MMHRQKSHVDLLEDTASGSAPGRPYIPVEKAASLYTHIAGNDDRAAFVDNLKVQIETDDYCIDNIALVHCLQKAPLTNALLHLDVDGITNRADESLTT